MNRATKVAGAAMVALLALPGCSGVDDQSALLRCDEPGRDVASGVLLMAQSVPTASMVPCLGAMPPDWQIGDFDARSGRGRFELHYLVVAGGDRRGVKVELTRRCDRGGAREVVSDRRGMRRYDRVERDDGRLIDQRFYSYPGGCTTYRFDLRGIGAREQADEVADAVEFVSREEISRQIREVTNGRLELDPSNER